MPTFAIVAGVRITFYIEDHDPAHFHAKHDGREARVRIQDLGVMNSTLAPAKLRAVLAWAATNQASLLTEWARLRDATA